MLSIFLLLFFFSDEAAASLGPDRSFRLDLGTSLVRVEYQEAGASDVRVEEDTVTAKLGLNFALGPKSHLHLGGFKTVAVLTNNNQGPGAPESDWLGINAKLGYTLFQKKKWDFTVSPGWYYWQMNTENASGNEYGVGSMVGPQVTFSLRMGLKSKRIWQISGKIAYIAGASGSGSAQEWAAGFGVQPFATKRATGPMLVFDYSSLDHDLFSVSTIGGGLQFSF